MHFPYNVLWLVPKDAQNLVAAALRAIFSQKSRHNVLRTSKKAIALLEEKYPITAEMLRDIEGNMLVHMSFPT